MRLTSSGSRTYLNVTWSVATDRTELIDMVAVFGSNLNHVRAAAYVLRLQFSIENFLRNPLEMDSTH